MATEAGSAAVAVNGSWGVFRDESRRWLGARGLVHLVFWLLLIDGWLYFTVVTEHMPWGGLGFESLINMLVLFPMLAAIILAEAMVVGEYHSGIAGWTVSKPVPRWGYVGAKLVGLGVALSAVTIFVPGLVAYWWLPRVQPYRFVTPEAPPLGRFLATLALVSLVLLFFVTLTGFLGTAIRRRGVVALIALFAYVILRFPPEAAWGGWDRFTASGLISAPLPHWMPLTEFVYGNPLAETGAVVWTIVAVVAFTAGAALIYRRLEL